LCTDDAVFSADSDEIVEHIDREFVEGELRRNGVKGNSCVITKSD